MLPFDEWTGNSDAMDPELAQRLADEKWPDWAPEVEENDLYGDVSVLFKAGPYEGRYGLHRLPKHKTFPKNWTPWFWMKPPDWSEAALRRAYDVIDAEIRAKEPA